MGQIAFSKIESLDCDSNYYDFDPENNFQLAKRFENGTLHFLSIYAAADISIDDENNPGHKINFQLTSGGVHGILSDTAEEDKSEMYKDELAVLKNMLKGIQLLNIS